MKVIRGQYDVGGEPSRRQKTLQTEVVDVLRALDDLMTALAHFPDFEGLPLEYTLKAIKGERGREARLPPSARRVAGDLLAYICNGKKPQTLDLETRSFARGLLTDLRVGEVAAQDLVKAIARRRIA